MNTLVVGQHVELLPLGIWLRALLVFLNRLFQTKIWEECVPT